MASFDEVPSGSTAGSNGIQFPMDVHDRPFVEARDETIAITWETFDPKIEGGKWLLFYPKPILNAMWERIWNHYHDHKLRGITHLKSYTSMNSDSSRTDGVIMCFCGPASNKHLVISYGLNLIEVMGYRNLLGNMYYKTEMQSRGYSAQNHKYKLPVAKPWEGYSGSEESD